MIGERPREPKTLEITRTLADYAMSLEFERLPKPVVEVAKHCFLDWIGVTLAGLKEPITRILMEQAESDGGAQQASLVGSGRRVTLAQAALINGSASHALDYDDVQERFHGHPTAPVAPVVLALAELKGLSGREILTAFVAGVEVECRINVFMGDSHYERGWHSTATNGAFGAAVGASRLLGFEGERCALAMGVAGTQAAGLRSMFGTMCKPLHAGKAAQNGLFAAQLIDRGLTSRPDVLERPLGYGDTQSDGLNTDAALDGLGEAFEVSDVLFKYHAACHGVHATIEAIRSIRRKIMIDHAEVERIEIAVQSEYMNICGIDKPSTGLEGKFSLSFCAAVALTGGDTSDPSTYSDRSVRDPKLIDLADKVQINPRPEMEMKVAEVMVHMRNGAVYREHYDVGIPERNLARQWESLTTKFRACASPVLATEKVESLIAAVGNLDCANDVSSLVKAWS
jgi:2-methylcitrate dehydratase PrpD